MKISIDKSLSLLLYNLIYKNKNINKDKVSILMYHSITSDIEKMTTRQYYEINTDVNTFAKHLKLIEKNNIEVIKVEDIERYENVKNTKNKIAITFDDGYQDFYRYAFALLKKHKYPAMVYIPTGYIGDARNVLSEKKCLTWKEIQLMSKDGISFGSHTVSHPKLIELEKKQIEFEISQSKKDIERKLQKEIKAFCYPYSFPSENINFKKYLKKVLTNNGYKHCATTTIGLENIKSNYFLKRIPINLYDNEKMFMAKINGAYDWMYIVQKLNKLRKYKRR